MDLCTLYELNHKPVEGSFHYNMALTYKKIYNKLNSSDRAKVNKAIKTHKRIESLEEGKAGWYFSEIFKELS